MRDDRKEPTFADAEASRRGKSLKNSSFTQGSTERLLTVSATTSSKNAPPTPTASLTIAKRIVLTLVAASLLGIAFISAPHSSVPDASRTAATSGQTGDEIDATGEALNASTSSSRAGFQYITEVDAFTGAILPSVHNRNASGQTIAITRPDQNQGELSGNVAFLMDPGGYICPSTTDGKVLIEHLIVVNGSTKPLGGIRWGVSESRSAFLLTSGFYSDHVYDALREAEEIRFRYTDACHETKTMIFRTENLEEALTKLGVQ